MYTFLSWLFLILAPTSFVGVLYITFKRLKSNILSKLFIGIFLGAALAFIMFFISAYLGMNTFW